MKRIIIGLLICSIGSKLPAYPTHIGPIPQDCPPFFENEFYMPAASPQVTIDKEQAQQKKFKLLYEQYAQKKEKKS